VEDLENKEVFFKSKGILKIVNCNAISKADKQRDYSLSFSYYDTSETQDQEKLSYTLKELIIRPRTIYLPISKSSNNRSSELKVINWLKENKILTYIYMKKPVNNIEIGYIKNLNLNIEESYGKENKDEKKSRNFLTLENIFTKEVIIPYDSLESLSFDYNSALIQIKSETSLFSRFGFKILKKFKPEKIIIT
jgi:hypothetical protein